MSYFSTCFVAFVLFLNTVLVKCIESNEIQVTNRTCIPAEALPSLNLSYCQPLYNFTKPFCKDHGIKLDDYVYHHPDDYSQYYRNYHANLAEIEVRLARKEFGELLRGTSKCENALFLFFCRNYYPSCDATRHVYQEKKICRESCLEGLNICGKIFKILRKVYLVQHPWQKAYLYCKQQPYRNAGKSPECWYYTGDTNFTKEGTPTHCLYLNGSSYQGNISITVSGTPCQSWTAQCPHRHTMNTTYPELNKAKNYCRNPQNSGKRPWCFTTDRNTRWEYCDIPKCKPVNGNYGNWTLSRPCNVICGQGFEIWKRTCNTPTPKYGGKNCSHLGNSTEYRVCTRKPCPVNGGYSNWTLSSPCSASCGEGFEIWQRFCDNPPPRNGGINCSVLGNSTSVRQCIMKPCPIDGNYSNWTKTSQCSVSCGKGFEIWTRKCDNPAPKYGGSNCSKQGIDREIRQCNIKLCPVKRNVKMIGIITGVGIAVITLVILVLVFIRKRRHCKRDDDFTPYAILNFQPQLLLDARLCEDSSTLNETTSPDIDDTSSKNSA